MSARYSKVLTWHNAQMFAGGALISTTVGYVCVLSQMERTEAVQRRLKQVQRHMYWSMAITQRPRVDEILDGQCCARSRQRRWDSDRVDHWWNSKISDLSYWAVAPGYLSQKAQLAKSLGDSWIESEWSLAKASVARSRRRTMDFIISATKWNEATGLARGLWEDEKAKWQHAHSKAIEAVHPLYQNCAQSTPAKRIALL
ncbi:hypothetical protein IWW39_005665 [Coemansia spiralis]|uniref:Uncharacterized protein n=1 Tax=Coemansia spiralis TaxID=417178 RepID=A0A9W8GEQ1_9FUNG|nr:hypothetical protein IWW39_005665 [Coemansia spiralis]